MLLPERRGWAQARASFQTHVAASGLARDSVACSSLETAQGLGVGLIHSSLWLPHSQTQILCNCLDECGGSTLCPANKIKGCSQAGGRQSFIAVLPVDTCKPSLCKYSQQPKSSKQRVGSTSFVPAVPTMPPTMPPPKAAQATAHSSKTHSGFSILSPTCLSYFAQL